MARLTGTRQGHVFNNVFHAIYTGGAPNAGQLQSFANSFLAAYNASFLTFLDVNCTTDAVEAVDLAANTGASAVGNGTPGVGSRAGSTLTNQVAAVISWKINLRYRGGHPRTYLPAGVLADVLTGNTWDVAFWTGLESAAASFLTAVNAIASGGITYKLATVSYFSAKVLRPTPFTLPVQGAVVHTRVDTQRRRLGKESA